MPRSSTGRLWLRLMQFCSHPRRPFTFLHALHLHARHVPRPHRSPRDCRRLGKLTVAAGNSDLFLGVDCGTSGIRATAIDEDKNSVVSVKEVFTKAADIQEWERALYKLLSALPPETASSIRAIAIDGTSSTALLCDSSSGEVLAGAKLYNEAQNHTAVELAQQIAPESHTATAPTSTLCKLLSWHLEATWQEAAERGKKPVLLHQADWLAGCLHGHWDKTDWNNALKLGYDPEAECYPEWLTSQEIAHLLPSQVLPPGSPVAPVTESIAAKFHLPNDCLVCAGTTDSIAAFLAAGVQREGDAVTSLGSSLAVKLLSRRRVDDAAFGVYSHRLGDTWLVGGASNTGGAVLKKFFTSQQLAELSERMNSDFDTGLDFYPLLSPGERFPINDANLQPRLEPRPDDDAVFLQAMLEGIANIEARAYQQLQTMGASPLKQVLTAGGGAVNEKWTQMRAARLGVPVLPSMQAEAAYGAALLARQGYHQKQQS